MNPYIYVKEATDKGESLLSLCSGIGLELNNLNTSDIAAVDIAPQYLEELKRRCAEAKTVCMDASKYIKSAESNSVDVISFIDGVEHMTKEAGLETLKHCKRVARKKVLVFTPEGYLRNEPHNAWGIEGADEHQTHKSGWEVSELEDLGYKLVAREPGTSQHGEPYHALMFIYTKE